MPSSSLCISGETDSTTQSRHPTPSRVSGDGGNIDTCRLWVLGDFHSAKGQLEDAETLLDDALACAKYDECAYQQSNILRSMGTL
jgi:hypothetical protein